MKKRLFSLLLAASLSASMLAGCTAAQNGTNSEFSLPNRDYDKDYSALRTPGAQEESCDYRLFFRPAIDGISQPFVGDPMPYYEDGVFYVYYLKEGGDSYNHSIYLATTTDFLHYDEVDAPIIEANRAGGQDGWIGTGSVVKVGEKYYFFYTAHASSDTFEYREKIFVCEGSSPYAFTKVENWELLPPDELGQKTDFRDPQAYYNDRTEQIELTVTASQGGTARILKFTLSGDLSESAYDGVIFSDPTGTFWNLECSDTFCFDGKWYLTYSGQDDTLWYAASDSPYGPYGEARRLDGKLFYAAKHVSDGEACYMVGWARRSESASSTQEVSAWGGNLVVQQLAYGEDGALALKPTEQICAAFSDSRMEAAERTCAAGAKINYTEAFYAYERFLLTGSFCFSGSGRFGLAFAFGGSEEEYKLLSICPETQKLLLSFGGGTVPIAETAMNVEQGKTYSFTYLQEGSVGTFYLDGEAALTVRLYGVSGKPIRLFSENNTVTWTSLCEYTMPMEVQYETAA